MVALFTAVRNTNLYSCQNIIRGQLLINVKYCRKSNSHSYAISAVSLPNNSEEHEYDIHHTIPTEQNMNGIFGTGLVLIIQYLERTPSTIHHIKAACSSNLLPMSTVKQSHGNVAQF